MRLTTCILIGLAARVSTFDLDGSSVSSVADTGKGDARDGKGKSDRTMPVARGKLSSNPAGDGSECQTMRPICTDDRLSYPAQVTEGEEADLTYHCLDTAPNRMWFYFEIDQSGSLQTLVQGDSDVDFVIWGPYSSRESAMDNCGSLDVTTPVDCSYASDEIETPSVPNATSGEFYILMVTNFANEAQDIAFTNVSPVATLSCEAVETSPPSPPTSCPGLGPAHLPRCAHAITRLPSSPPAHSLSSRCLCAGIPDIWRM